MTTKKVAILGMGGIGMSVVEIWRAHDLDGHTLVAVCGRARQAEAMKSFLPEGTVFTTTIDDLLAARPDIVVEAAGHGGAIEAGCRTLHAGADLYLLSTGKLADERIRSELIAAAAASGRSIIMPPGALAGFDGLMALIADGDADVTYLSTKPPSAWTGTHAETSFDLKAITAATTIFDGSAGEAATLYPRNANLAAAVALAGVGFARTRVILIADPAAHGNLGEIRASNPSSSLVVRVDGQANADNPKTSQIVGASVISALRNAGRHLRFG